MVRLFLLGLIVVFAVLGCSSGANEDAAKEAAANNEAEEMKENLAETNDAETNETENDDANTDADDSEVEINLPAEFFDGQSEEEVIESFKEDGIGTVVVNDDGSFTLTMTKDQPQVN